MAVSLNLNELSNRRSKCNKQNTTANRQYTLSHVHQIIIVWLALFIIMVSFVTSVQRVPSQCKDVHVTPSALNVLLSLTQPWTSSCFIIQQCISNITLNTSVIIFSKCIYYVYSQQTVQYFLCQPSVHRMYFIFVVLGAYRSQCLLCEN